MATVTDSFNRADGGLGVNWSGVSGPIELKSNALTYTTGGSATVGAAHNGLSASGAAYAQIKITTRHTAVNTEWAPGPSVRTTTAAPSGDGIRLSVQFDGAYRVLHPDGIYTSASGKIANGDTLRVEYRGGKDIAVLINGVTDWTYTYTGATPAGTNTGIYCYYAANPSPVWVIDDFEAGDLVAAPTLTSPTVTNVTGTGATAGCTTDTPSGVFYVVATNSTTAPTAAQIKLGQDHTGTSASSYGGAAGSVTVTTTLPSVALTGMTTGSTRRIYAVQTASGVDSAVLSYPNPVYPGTWRTAGEVSATGWTVTGAASFAAAVNEDTASDAEFAQSPALGSTPTVRIDALDRSLPAGTYVTKIRLSMDTGSGFVRVSFLDGSNNVQGQSASQAFTATTTTFDVITTTTGASVRRRIELWV